MTKYARKSRKGRRKFRKRARGKMMIRGAKKMRGTTKWKNGPPQTMMVKLPYVETLNFVSAGSQDYWYKINSMYDPNFTGGGHQPLAFDQLFTNLGMWSIYEVLAVKINLEATNADDNEMCHVSMGLGYQTASAPYTSSTGYDEAPEYQTCVIGTANSGISQKRLKNFYKMRKLYANGYNQEDAIGTIVSSPNVPVYLHIRFAGLQTTTNINVVSRLRLTFYAKAIRPTPMAQSNI